MIPLVLGGVLLLVVVGLSGRHAAPPSEASLHVARFRQLCLELADRLARETVRDPSVVANRAQVVRLLQSAGDPRLPDPVLYAPVPGAPPIPPFNPSAIAPEFRDVAGRVHAELGWLLPRMPRGGLDAAAQMLRQDSPYAAWVGTLRQMRLNSVSEPLIGGAARREDVDGGSPDVRVPSPLCCALGAAPECCR